MGVFLRYADKEKYRDIVNEIIDSMEVLQMIAEKLMSISQNEDERARFRSRRKFLTDYQSDMNTSWDNGLAEGIIKGREEGITEGIAKGIATGRAEGFMEVARKMLKRGRPLEEILEDTGLSREEVERLRRE